MALKSGFFDAESFNEETIEGETVLVPDRAYTPDDFNTFFNGIISDTGVFYQTGDVVNNQKQPPFLCEAIPDNDLTESDPAGKFKIKIKTGTGRILGHHIRITGEEYVYIDQGDADGNRCDWIVLRLNNPARTLEPAVSEGRVVDTTATPTSSLPTLNQDKSTSNPDIYEIAVAYVFVPRNATSSSDIRITPQTGQWACPWITHMVYTTEGENKIMQQLDGWLTQYGQSINDWLQNLINNLEVSTNVVQFFKTYNASAGDISSISLPDTLVGSTGSYKYNAGDVFNIFYNGLRLINGTDYTISDDGILTLKNTVIRGDNELYVHVLKSQIGIPSYVDGDLELY